MLYNMPSIPQSMYVNPAQMPLSRVNVGMPVLSSIYFHGSNNGFSYNDLFEKRADDSITFAFGKLIDKLKDKNLLNIAFQPDLISFGFVVKKKNYFSFNATEKISVFFHYPKDLFKFFWYGNAPYLGENIDFNFAADITHYREYALGYAREVNDKLNVGGKIKYLYGMENINVKKANLGIYTDPNTNFPITITTDVEVNTSGLDTASTKNIQVADYLFKRKNSGFGIDLGGTYDITDKINVSASVIDLGYIKWKDAPVNYVSNEPGAQLTFSGVDLNQFLNNSNNTDSLATQTLDSIQERFKLAKKNDVYKTSLHTKFYIGGNYQIYEKNTAGVLVSGMMFNNTINPAFTIYDRQQVGYWLSVSLSYTIMNRAYNNLGFGFSINGGPIQYYMVSDNVLSIFMPDKTRNVNVRFGINYTFGRKPLDKDKDKVADVHDECPDVKGLVEFKGCPDKDNDKVPDKLDRCPEIAGDPAKEGCPDRDNDGIHDFDDACPDSSGTVEMKGCPDKDGDKIADKDDECPDQAGIEKFRGCPDTDGDGLKDKLDLCPDKAGPEKNGGCPEVKLNLLDKKGNATITSDKGADGAFKFDVLPPDSLAAFKLENADPLPASISINQGSTGKTAYKENDNIYRFPKPVVIPTAPEPVVTAPATNAKTSEPIAPAKPEKAPVKEEQPVAPLPPADNTAPTLKAGANQKAVELKEEEKEIVKKAFTNLEFEVGKDWIKETSFDELDVLAEMLKKHPTWKIKLAGHTDNVGDAMKNLELSRKRAEMVKKFFTLKGIDGSRIDVDAQGSRKPVADNKTPQGRQKNRRVEMLIVE